MSNFYIYLCKVTDIALKYPLIIARSPSNFVVDDEAILSEIAAASPRNDSYRTPPVWMEGRINPTRYSKM